jgi:hypothetical protein
MTFLDCDWMAPVVLPGDWPEAFRKALSAVLDNDDAIADLDFNAGKMRVYRPLLENATTSRWTGFLAGTRPSSQS